MATQPNLVPTNNTAIQRRQSILNSAIKSGEWGCFLILTALIGVFFLCAGVTYITLHWLDVF